MANLFPAPGPFGVPGERVEASAMRARSPFDDAFDTIEQMRRADVVNLPEAPQPEENPFQHPLVMLGMSLQGRSAEAVSASQTIEARNRARMDRYQSDVLQAHNYKQLRQQKFAMTLASLKSQGAQEGIRAAERELDRIEGRQVRKETAATAKDRDEQAQANADRAFELQKQQFEIQRQREERIAAEGKSAASITELYIRSGNEQFTQWQNKKIALRSRQILRPGPNPGDKPLAYSLDTMTPEQSEAALKEVEAELLGGLRDYYFSVPSYMASEGEYIKSLVQSFRDADAEMKTRLGDTKFGPPTEGGEDPALTPEQRRDRASNLLQFQQLDASAAEDIPLDTTAGLTEFVTQFSGMMDSGVEADLAEGVIGLREQGARGPQGRLLQTAQGASVEVQGRMLRDGLAADPYYLTYRPGKSNLLTLAREVSQQMLTSDMVRSGNKEDAWKQVRHRLMVEFGVAKGYADGPGLRREFNKVFKLLHKQTVTEPARLRAANFGGRG